MAQQGTCRLCGAVGEILDSHVIPRWVYKRANLVDTSLGSGLAHVETGKGVILSGKQISEHMLCERCENRFRTWENYVHEQSLQLDDRFPALEHATPIPGFPAVVRDASVLDREKLVRFAVSVAWRAAVCSKMPDNTLGKYEPEVRAYLLVDGSTLPGFARVWLELTLVQPRADQNGRRLFRVDHAVRMPRMIRAPGYFIHHFYLFGMSFSVCIGNLLERGLDEVCLTRHPRLLVNDGADHRDFVFRTTARERPKGKLAKLFPSLA